MSRAGAKRKWKGSTPGRQNVRHVGEDRLAAQWLRHRDGLPEGQIMDARAATAFGRLNLNGFISDVQHQAGLRYIVVVGEYRASIGIPDTGNREGKGYACLGERNCEYCECRRRKRRYDDAYEAVIKVGPRVARVVSHKVIYDQSCGKLEMNLLRMGLDALADHFRLTNRRKSA